MLSYESPYNFNSMCNSPSYDRNRNYTTMDVQIDTPPDNSFHDIMAQKYTSSKYRMALAKRSKYKDCTTSILNDSFEYKGQKNYDLNDLLFPDINNKNQFVTKETFRN